MSVGGARSQSANGFYPLSCYHEGIYVSLSLYEGIPNEMVEKNPVERIGHPGLLPH